MMSGNKTRLNCGPNKQMCVSTGCGKTYTMLGTDREPGIYVRTLNDLFKAIEETSDDMQYSVSMSYLEVRASFGY